MARVAERLTMSDPPSTASLSDMPADELARYGHELGLAVTPSTPRGELLRRVRERQKLLGQLDRQAMLDVVVWARLPVRESATREALAREIVGVRKMRFDGLSNRGLRVLARLREIEADDGEGRAVILERLRKAEGLWKKLGRKGRGMVGGMVAQFFEKQHASDSDYRFLPESAELREQIEEQGVVTGIARKLRGAADDYIAGKLDEIELRIDRKLDEIDQRLAEWRDREVANRLRIIKLTLVGSLLVALLSLGYHYVSRYATGSTAGAIPAETNRAAEPPASRSGGASNGDLGFDADNPMYEHLSKRMEEIVRLANEIAREYELEYVGTEHVLLAILREGTGTGARVLNARGLSEARVKREVNALIKRSMEETWVFGRLPGSPHFKNVMAAAIEAARELKSREVCSEHMLLGLLQEDGSVAHAALSKLGITREIARTDIVQFTSAAPEAT